MLIALQERIQEVSCRHTEQVQQEEVLPEKVLICTNRPSERTQNEPSFITSERSQQNEASFELGSISHILAPVILARVKGNEVELLDDSMPPTPDLNFVNVLYNNLGLTEKLHC